MFHRHLTIFLLFLPAFLLALDDRLNIDLLELYISAIKQYDLNIFKKVLDDNFVIYDENNVQITDRQRLLGLNIHHFRQRIPIRPYEVYDNVPGVSFKVRINPNFLIGYNVSKGQGKYKIMEETYLTAQKDGLGFFPLVDYDNFTKKIAKQIVSEYSEELVNATSLNNILDVDYQLFGSNEKDRSQVKEQLKMFKGHVVAKALDDKLITNAKFLGDRKFEFIWNHTTVIQAKYNEHKKKYLITLEMQGHDSYPFLSDLIDYELTAHAIAHNLAKDFYKSMSGKSSSTFKMLFSDEVEYQECNGSIKYVPRETFLEDHLQFVKTVPKVFELYQIKKEFRNGKMSFWMYLVPKQQGIAVIFDVDLVNKKNRLIKRRCMAKFKVNAKLTRFL